MKGADVLIRCLEELNVKYIFGYPGGANLPIYDALYSSKKLEHILAYHEQGATLMADGYARIAMVFKLLVYKFFYFSKQRSFFFVF